MPILAGSDQDLRWRIPGINTPQTITPKEKTATEKNAEAYKNLLDENGALKSVIKSVTEVNDSLLKEIESLKEKYENKQNPVPRRKAQKV